MNLPSSSSFQATRALERLGSFPGHHFGSGAPQSLGFPVYELTLKLWS